MQRAPLIPLSLKEPYGSSNRQARWFDISALFKLPDLGSLRDLGSYKMPSLDDLEYCTVVFSSYVRYLEYLQ